MFILCVSLYVIYQRYTLRKIKPSPYISKFIERVCLHFRLAALSHYASIMVVKVDFNSFSVEEERLKISANDKICKYHTGADSQCSTSSITQ